MVIVFPSGSSMIIFGENCSPRRKASTRWYGWQWLQRSDLHLKLLCLRGESNSSGCPAQSRGITSSGVDGAFSHLHVRQHGRDSIVRCVRPTREVIPGHDLSVADFAIMCVGLSWCTYVLFPVAILAQVIVLERTNLLLSRIGCCWPLGDLTTLDLALS